MTSLFDFSEPSANSGPPMPVDLINSGGRGIAPLEFFAVEDEERERMAREVSDEHNPEYIARAKAVQLQAMLDAARAEACAETRVVCEQEFEERLRVERGMMDRICSEFATDRQRYFAAAEAQVVKLAIAVARRILAREVEADVMHLTATVRAALSRVRDGSASVLRVPGEQLQQWSEIFSGAPAGSITVVADERLGAGACLLETDVGRVEFGVPVQLAEIERGFGDLLRRQGE